VEGLLERERGHGMENSGIALVRRHPEAARDLIAAFASIGMALVAALIFLH